MSKGLCNNCNTSSHVVLYEENKAQYQQIVKCTNCRLIYVKRTAQKILENKR